MKRLYVLAGILMLFGLAVVQQPAAAQGGMWTAEYFNNPNLIGPAVLVQSEASPSHEWGWGAPAAGIPADYFSARWTTTAYLNAGTYQISVRVDDGVRVYVNGVLYINEWHPATGQTYSATIPLTAGNHTFVIEFYEAAEVAFVRYSFNAVGVGPIPGTPQATVTTYRLNVRSIPNPYTGTVIAQISQGETYPVIGRNADTSWLQLNVNGLPGWVNARYVAASNIGGVPITDGGSYPTPPPPPPPGATAAVTAYLLNVRNQPNPFTGAVLAQIRRNEIYPVVGRNLDTSWVQINVRGVIGWVRSSWVALSNMAGVPVTSNTTNPTQPGTVQAYGTVRAYFLNVRSQPYYGAPVLTIIGQSQTYPVVGRNASSTWAQINVGGTVGWVNSAWLIINPGLSSVPVTG
jgi:uncharacterized protein YraI